MNLICLALQPATEDDLPFLLTLRKATMTEHLDRAGVPQDDEHHLARIRHHFSDAQIVWFHGRPAGLFKAHRDPAGWRLVQIQIDPAFQGQGLGRRLLAGLLEQADAEGAPVTLSVLDGNPRAGSTRRWASRPRKPGARCATRPERRARPGHIRGPLGGVNRAGPDFFRTWNKQGAGSVYPRQSPTQLFPRGTPCANPPQPCWPGRRRPVLGRRPGPARQGQGRRPGQRSRHDPLHLRQGRGRQERLQRPVRQDLAARHGRRRRQGLRRPHHHHPRRRRQAVGLQGQAGLSVQQGRQGRRQERRQLQDVWHAAKP